MANKEDNSSLTGFYSMEKFIKELKKISGLPEVLEGTDDIQRGSPMQTSMEFNNTILSPYCKNRAESKSKKGGGNMSNNNEINGNEKMKSEMTKLRKENAELKFCLNNINKKYDNELKDIKSNSELKETKEILKKNASLIEILGEKIKNYEKSIRELEERQNLEEEEAIKSGDEKYIALIEKNKKLNEELKLKETMINNIKNELNTKNEIFEEINTMKSEMETYLQTMDKLYGEIESRDGIIKQLKNDMQSMQTNYQQEINELKKQNTLSNSNSKELNKNSNSEKNDEKLLLELKQSKEKEMKLNKELLEIQKNYNEMKENNEKMKELTKETNGMIKTAIYSRDSLKKEYENAIKGVIEKYEKEIKNLKMQIAKQNSGKNENKDNEKDVGNKNLENKNEKSEEETKMVEMMKIIQDNKELLKQNEELKNMNEAILSKKKELPNLDQKYNDLFDMVKVLQDENHFLKEASKYSSMIELSQSKIKEIPSDTNINNTNTNDLFEETPKTKSQINKKKEINQSKKAKNLLLDDDDDYDEENSKEKNDKKEKENESENSNKEKNKDNKEKEKVPAIRQKEIIFENKMKNNINSMNMSNSEISNDNNSQIRIYNKKKLQRQSSPKSIKDNNIYHRNSFLMNNNNSNIDNKRKDKNYNNNSNKKYNEENDNDEIQKEEELELDSSENNLINANFNLYKPIKEGLLTFNLAKKNYYTVVPEKYDEFWESFDAETSVQYNTLEGLFLINSKKNNQLYYYSSKKNTFSALFQFTEDHSYGCLFLDNLSKNIIAIGGKRSKLVEKFSFENGNMEQLPQLSTHRSKMTCCQVLNKIYCFLGICEERPNDSIVEYLDLDNLEQGWNEVKFDNQTSFTVLTGMSCVNLNDSELFIIGGLINDELPNEKLLYFNTEQNELFELNKDLPDSEDKHYLFTKNTMFNLFLNGNIISFTNIDDNNQVHILDNELKYDLYLTPKI